MHSVEKLHLYAVYREIPKSLHFSRGFMIVATSFACVRLLRLVEFLVRVEFG